MKKLISIIGILLILSLIVGCASTGRNFDEEKVKDILKGQTSQQEILKFFGKPNSKGITNDGTDYWQYIYASSAYMGSTKTKTLTVYFNKENIVSNYEYSEMEM